MPFAFFRRMPVVHRRSDRTFELLLRPAQVEALDAYLGELDRILGSFYAYVEQCFRPALRIGFASRFGA